MVSFLWRVHHWPYPKENEHKLLLFQLEALIIDGHSFPKLSLSSIDHDVWADTTTRILGKTSLTCEEGRSSLLCRQQPAEFPTGVLATLESSWSKYNALLLETLPRAPWPGVGRHYFYKRVFIFQIRPAVSPSHLSKKQSFGIHRCLFINFSVQKMFFTFP